MGRRGVCHPTRGDSGAGCEGLLRLIVIILVGILSRTVHTGSILLDKYLGDALYAAMVYEILRLFRRDKPLIVPAIVLMLAIELFQLTMIPAGLYARGGILKLVAILLGTHFSFADLAAYAVGLAGIYLIDVTWPRKTSNSSSSRG